MARFDFDSIITVYDRNLKAAIAKLSQLEVYCGCIPAVSGLNGWVFEQTIQFCLRQELRAIGVRFSIDEQVPLSGKVKVDFVVGPFAVEIKSRGLFGVDGVERCRSCKDQAKEKGLEYLFFTRQEGHRPYREGIVDALGRKDAFFLDTEGDWERFVNRIASGLPH